MGQSTEELRRDIARTRDELSGDLEAIGDRVSPKRMMERRTSRVKDFFATSRSRVFGRADDVRSGTVDRAQQAAETMRDIPDRAVEQVEGNPLAAGAVAFGMGFLAAVVFPGSQTEARAAQRLAEEAEPITEGMTEGAKEAARQVAASAQEAGREVATQLKESATDKAQQLKETVSEEKDALQSPS
jgi:ElaB/YqjD/DUF883 family membrane-anchored ribosome-binding protein